MDLETLVAVVVALSLPVWLLAEQLIQWMRPHRDPGSRDTVAPEVPTAPTRTGVAPAGPSAAPQPMAGTA